jgi:hypothetical protein
MPSIMSSIIPGILISGKACIPPGQKERLVRAASVMAIGGLAAVALAVSAAVLLVTSFVGGGLAAGLITVFVACLFGLLWFVFPLARRR